MYTKKITDSDAFTEMSSAAQALYFHLNQGADDDGFNNQIQMAMFKAHASTDDLKILLAKNFIIRFESGVIVIKHWRMHNTIRKDRYVPTNFQEELEQLSIKDNGAYTLGCQVVAERLPSGCQVVAAGKVSKGKDSIGEYRVVECSENGNQETDSDCEEIVDNSIADSKLELVGGTLGRGVVLLSQAQMDALLEELGFDGFNYYVGKLATFIIEKKATVVNHYATIRKWAKEDMKI
jgi:hypothetical protein